MEKMYSLEFLIEKFISHGYEFQEDRKQQVAEFQSENPGVPLPKGLAGDFNLALALASICQEIKNSRSPDPVVKIGHLTLS